MKKIEDNYKSVDELEHVRIRPDMYIGSVVPSTVSTHITNDQDGNFELKEIEYTAGMLKLCDEVISNSVDEHKRCLKRQAVAGRTKVHILNQMNVTVTEDGWVTVSDNGGIPVAYHTVDKCYVPQMIFGKLRAGSNFDDTEQRNGVGRNGVGSSLANILSTEFSVSTCDGEASYSQTWTDGMTKVGQPKIILQSRKRYGANKYPTKGVVINEGMKTEKALKVNIDKVSTLPERGTTIKFKIDMSIFPQEESISYGVMKLIERKCIVAAASNIGLSVTFNGHTFKFDSFSEYVSMYGHENLITGKHSTWEYVIAPVGSFEGNTNHSLVNGAECSMGTHVSHANSLIRKHLKVFMEKKHKMKFTNDNISSQYVLFLNMNVVNPVYDSQTKEKLETAAKNYDGNNGGEPKILSSSLIELEKSNIVKNLIDWYNDSSKLAEIRELRKKDTENKKKSPKTIEKLIDATATTSKRKDCSLWIFEGQSAGSQFRSVRTPLTQGAYTLKGKLKNLFGKTKSEISKNKELNDIAMALGLSYVKETNIDKLRYRNIIIAVDADMDGICICGQLLAFFYQFYPELVENGLVHAVESPLYKLYKGRGKSKQVKYIYSQEEFEKTAKRGWNVEYFKGLGSLGKEEYEEMVNNPRLTQFFADEETEDMINLWMGGDAEPKKRFIENYTN